MTKVTWLVVLLASMAMFCGCESDDDDSSSSTSSNGDDDIDISTISWLGANFSAATISAKINSASLDNDNIVTAYDPYSWPRITVSGANVDAICCLFYERGGQIVGGKFDWWRAGGQGAKILENVHHGYNGHSFPASGTPTYTMIVSVDGSQRSNIKRCDWR